MLKIYCTECGSPTNYAGAKPKFCSNCGNPFEKLVVNKVLNQKLTASQIRRPIINENDYDENDILDSGEEVNHVPNIKKIDCEIINTSIRGEKISNIMGTSDGSQRSRGPKEKGKKLTKADRKKFLEEFAKEAGSIRPKNKARKNG